MSTIAESVQIRWAARGRVPSVDEVREELCKAYEAGRKAGSVELFNRVRDVMRRNYIPDTRPTPYCEVVEQMLAVAANALTDAVGEEVKS
jgi:hypothetical protein